MDLEHECTLNNETYHIQITRDSNEQKNGHNEVLITEGDVNDVSISPYISIPDLEKYEKLYQVKNAIYSYFENNGGSCKEYISEYNENN
jgi:transcription initiation factor IIF auxiliary subunit